MGRLKTREWKKWQHAACFVAYYLHYLPRSQVAPTPVLFSLFSSTPFLPQNPAGESGIIMEFEADPQLQAHFNTFWTFRTHFMATF